MKQEWKNLRVIWNAEWDEITQKKLAEIVSPPGEKPFNHSYAGKLGKGVNTFTEPILERFSEHMGIPLSVMFAEVVPQISIKEKEDMNKIREMVAAMLAVDDIKSILFGKFIDVKKDYADELAQKKMPRVLCRRLEP